MHVNLASVYFTLTFYLDLILVPLTFSFDFYSHCSFFTCPFELHNKWCFNLFLFEIWSIQDLFYMKTPVMYSVHVIGWKIGIWIYFVKERTSQLLRDLWRKWYFQHFGIINKDSIQSYDLVYFYYWIKTRNANCALYFFDLWIEIKTRDRI